MKLTLDPGIRGCGVAAFDGAVVDRAGYVYNPHTRGNDVSDVRAMAYTVYGWWRDRYGDVQPDLFVCERPRIYTASKQRVKGRWTDPNDLPPLYGIDCAVAMMFPHVPAHAYWPRDWKGTLDGDAMIERIKKRVTPDELARIDLSCGESLEHNVWDAIGLGLKDVGRLERIRVIAR